MDKREIRKLLLETSWDELRSRAEATTLAHKGTHINTRGLIEFSNICRRNCRYCGLRMQNRKLKRYRLSQEEVIKAAGRAAETGVDTIVLQSGEGAAEPEWLAEVIKELKKTFGLTVTLSVGEQPRRIYEMWREAGADRYLLKHETADPKLYAALHPGHSVTERIECLKDLKATGYETGGGFMTGLPCQSLDSHISDLSLCESLGLEMAGIGPFLPQRDTPLAGARPGGKDLTLRLMAILRILLPDVNLPATTALATLDPSGGTRAGLLAGGNVLMPAFTPPESARQYAIYDDKNRSDAVEMARIITSCGRTHSLRV